MGNERKVLTRPALLLALLGLVLVGAGSGLWHRHQHDQAQTAAADQARRLANTLAGELGQRVNRHRTQLEQLAGRPASPAPTADQPLTPTAWQDDTRLLRVPDGTPVRNSYRSRCANCCITCANGGKWWSPAPAVNSRRC